MDSDELKEAMAEAGKAFADGLAANEEAKRERVEACAMAELRNEALHATQEVLGRERRANRNRVVWAVANYCSQERKDVLDSLKNDKRMPRSINYLERYNALLGMDDRYEVLRRLDQTIAKAETILDEVDEIDVDAALSEAAAEFAGRVYRLNGITVVEAEDQVDDETGMPPKNPITKMAESDKEFDQAIEDAFLDAFGAISEAEEQQAVFVADQDERVERFIAQLEEAVLAAEKVAKEASYAGAKSVAGNTLIIPECPAFDDSVVLEAELDVDQVRELAVEVRKSFKTFKQVVQDNGLFAAFSSEGTFGACRGWRFGYWWDDFLYDMSEFEGDIPGRDPARDIPSDVEEDEGGDTLEKSIERMREFNKSRYTGMLDDEFDEHVDAFWYGFKKLMENVNGLYRMNASAFNQYCNEVAEAAKQAAQDMGASSMDAHQVEEFCKEVDKRAKKEA